MKGSNFDFTLLDAGSQTRTKDCFLKIYGSKYGCEIASDITKAKMDDIINAFIQKTVDDAEESEYTPFAPTLLT